MANWLKVELNDLKEQAEDEEISFQQLGNGVADRLENLKPLKFAPLTNQDDKEYFTDDLDEIIEGFRNVDDEDEFNYTLVDLYDWGDIALDNHPLGRKLCWIGFAF